MLPAARVECFLCPTRGAPKPTVFVSLAMENGLQDLDHASPTFGLIRCFPFCRFIIQSSVVSASCTAQGGGGRFQNRKSIREVTCCDAWWQSEPADGSKGGRSVGLSIYLSIDLSMYPSIHPSINFYLSIYLSFYLSILRGSCSKG